MARCRECNFFEEDGEFGSCNHPRYQPSLFGFDIPEDVLSVLRLPDSKILSKTAAMLIPDANTVDAVFRFLRPIPENN